LNLLLDTQAFLWWIAGDDAMSPLARTAVGDEANAVFVSAASAWEIATKVRIGKLPNVASIAADLAAVLDQQGFVPFPISFGHGRAAGALPGPLKDSFRPDADRSGDAGRHGPRVQRAELCRVRCSAGLVTKPVADHQFRTTDRCLLLRLLSSHNRELRPADQARQ
jgi:PIN domain nuclease of toxin-antitoxin system